MSTHQRLVSPCLAIKVVAGKGNVVVNGGAMHLNCATSAQEDHPPHLTLMCFSPISVINNVVLDGIEAI